MAGKGVAKTRTVRQLDPVECGAASLTMILRYHGEQVSLEQMRAETDVTRNGCAAGNLVRAAQARGFECGGFRKTAEELRELDPPCIIWWGANHFVVLKEYIKIHAISMIPIPADESCRLRNLSNIMPASC